MTREEMTRACEIAASEVLKRSEQLKPAKSAIRDKRGDICERVFLGVNGDQLAAKIILQWTYLVAGSVGRICQVVHVQMRVIEREQGRFLRVVGFHLPRYEEQARDTTCLTCTALGFTECIVIEQDTSLAEF